MNPKQTAIKRAYSIHWHEVKDHVDENGWVTKKFSEAVKGGFYPLDIKICFDEENGVHNKWRPIQLKGIEDNNKWIPVSQETLPEAEEPYWVTEKETGKVRLNAFSKSTEHLWLSKFSHFQPIVKPEKPVY